jgi:LysR family transcriptional regulator, transcriptional activator of the cysJI operon
LSRKQFLASTLLMREQGSGSRRVVETALKQAGLTPKSFAKTMDLDSTEAIKSAVEARLGVGFVSRWAISKELELGALKIAQVEDIRVTRHFTLISRTGPEPQGPARVFRTFTLGQASLSLQNGTKTAPGKPPRADKPS